MTSIQQRAALQGQIWKIANDVRGAVDGWDFKQYVLGTLFYRFISENFAAYIEGGDDSIHYAVLSDVVITPEIRDDAIKTKGYFIYPSQLFARVVASANGNESLNTDLAAIFSSIENSALGYPSERDIRGLFADFDTTSNRLGNTVKDKNTRLAAVLKGVAELDFGDFGGSDFETHQIDLFGDAYEFLISNYAANAGKSGGEFFTPQHVSKLIAQLIDDSKALYRYVFHWVSFNYENIKALGQGARGDLNSSIIKNFKLPIPYADNPEKSLAEQACIVAILDKFDALTNSLTEGLPREIELRQKQYEHYRDLLLSFPKPLEQG